MNYKNLFFILSVIFIIPIFSAEPGRNNDQIPSKLLKLCGPKRAQSFVGIKNSIRSAQERKKAKEVLKREKGDGVRGAEST